MVRLVSTLLSGLALLGAAAATVADLTPDNFDDIVLQSGKPALVEFFAPWCGHCKNLAPVYEELGASYAWAADKKVTIAKVDADAHRSLGQRFGVSGFPTLKWFDGKSDKPEDYKGGRDLESLQAFVAEKSGVKAKSKAKAPSEVVMLDDKSFGEVVGSEKDVLVAFTAPWCGHCKSLAPIYETLAQDFKLEPDVVIAKVDAEAPNAKATAQEQGVKSYPTIKFFPKGNSAPIEYGGGRSEAAFITFLNEKAGTHRAIGGGLDALGGTVEALNEVVEQFYGKWADGAEKAKEVAASAQGKYKDYYTKVFEKIAANEEYAEKEIGRLEGMLKKGGLAPEKVDDLTSRTNILKLFGKKDEGKSEL
ncbi:disulfide isomerase [Diplodia corticola]|uniref:protein disulfide-isomerase n=1 Tax=Diplodia corticola TaxID=236234 RepID=A0A1J9RLK1_9PEZI|nr:disulfide isomerase [Diplodia corticola]OJD29391.1 disulfide isomerase [Diplodia corticola]